MRILLIHQNVPGQFRHLSRELIHRGHEVIGLGRNVSGVVSRDLRVGLYRIDEPGPGYGGSDRELERALRRAIQVQTACERLRSQGWIPDAVLFHSSWGEGLYLREVWPQQRLVAYPELYGTPWVLGYGYDAGLREPPQDLLLSMRHLNLLALAAIADSDAVVCPTRHQRDTFPAHLRQHFTVIHEGVDVRALAPHPQRCLVLGRDLVLRPGDPVLTFCSRHLEPLRGLHTLLRALPRVQRQRPDVQVLLVGANGKGYGTASDHPGGHLGALLQELAGQLDLERIHVLGRLRHGQLIGVYQVSAAHTYLTYPYALSWSLLEAMACGAAVVGSRGAPVQEVIRQGENGLLVDFNSPEQLSEALLQLLQDPPLRQRIGAAARSTVERHYSLEACTDAYEALLMGRPTAAASS
ncbi:MAG: glycosyltransferase [Cyanobium sp.]